MWRVGVMKPREPEHVGLTLHEGNIHLGEILISSRCVVSSSPSDFWVKKGKPLLCYYLHVSLDVWRCSGTLFDCPLLSRVFPWIWLVERDGRSRRWRRDERRIDRSIEERFHVSAHSFKKQASAALARRSGCARYVLLCKIKDQRLSGRLKELSGFYRLVHLHASSSRRHSLTFALFCLWVCPRSLSHFLPRPLRLASRSVSVSSVLL